LNASDSACYAPKSAVATNSSGYDSKNESSDVEFSVYVALDDECDLVFTIGNVIVNSHHEDVKLRHIYSTPGFMVKSDLLTTKEEAKQTVPDEREANIDRRKAEPIPTSEDDAKSNKVKKEGSPLYFFQFTEFGTYLKADSHELHKNTLHCINYKDFRVLNKLAHKGYRLKLVYPKRIKKFEPSKAKFQALFGKRSIQKRRPKFIDPLETNPPVNDNFLFPFMGSDDADIVESDLVDELDLDSEDDVVDGSNDPANISPLSVVAEVEVANEENCLEINIDDVPYSNSPEPSSIQKADDMEIPKFRFPLPDEKVVIAPPGF
jgi:hypothetical protein